MMFDFHMHSNFSADCETPMEATIESAIKKGLTEICFTEHIDYEYPDPTIVFDLDVKKYNETILQLQKKYKDVITIKKGVEIGVQPYLLDRYEELLTKETFDFIICSMHTTNKQGLHSGDFFKERTAEEAYRLYYEELLYCVEHFDHYSVLGHLDLVKRYQTFQGNEDFHDIIGEIFKIIIAKGKGIEVNTSGFAYGLGSAMPSEDILKLYYNCGGEIITIGSDAHKPEHVAHRFSEMIELLISIGFKYVATFEALQPKFHLLTDLKNKMN